MGRQLLILGDGSHSRSVADLARLCDFSEVLAAGRAMSLRDAVKASLARNCTLDEAILSTFSSRSWKVALGRASVDAAAANANLLETPVAREYEMPVLIHPSARVSPSAQISRGSQVFEGVIVKRNTFIAEGCVLQAGVIAEHDCYLACGSILAAGVVLGGHVRLGRGVFVGLGSVIRDGVSIGEDSVIGMGSVVTESVVSRVVAYGNPCRARYPRT